MRPRIGILTAFTGSDEAYSLVNVVKVQLQMLLDAGYKPVLFAAPTFSGSGIWSRVAVRKVAMPDDNTDAIAAALSPQLDDIDILFCHDIVFLSQHSRWAEAVCRVAVDHPRIAWVHWQHSRGDGQASPHPERSWFAYPNRGDLEHCADINQTDLDHVRYIPHPLDFDYLGWPDLAIRISEDHQYPFVDIAGVLPARLDRQKQVEKAVRLFAGLKRAGKSVSFLIADAYATGDRFIAYKREVEQIAVEQGLTDTEFCFLGEHYDECRYATPRAVVKALYEMGNLFVQPSNSETSSLVAMEAALAGNLLVINADFLPIHHLYGQALTLPFGSVIHDTQYYRHVQTADGGFIKMDDPQQFWDDEARKTVIPALGGQLSLSVKRQQLRDRWPSKVFADYIQPLITEIADIPAVEMHGDPEVTAIITTLDNLPMLEQQINILLSEVGHIIVVNNGSIDGTQEWLIDNPIPGMSYINRENNGAGPGRNAGLKLWNNSTAYTLMVDGGILPVRGAVAMLKDYLVRHPEVHVISPEVATCYTTNPDEASQIFDHAINDYAVFLQSCLSSTAFCLCRAAAWVVRFSEVGPFAEPGWGVDDNDMAYRWDDAHIYHRDFTYECCPVKFYRRASGSFQRIYNETGVWPNQYGSVYEQRNVMTWQNYPGYHRGLYGRPGLIEQSYVIHGVDYPDLARTIKRIHDEQPTTVGYEIIVHTRGLSAESMRWINQARLRFHWGDTQINHEGDIIRRAPDNEDLWTGDFMIDTEPRGGMIDVAATA